MKKVLFLVVIVFVFSCLSDNNDETNANEQNSFRVNNESYNITNAYLIRNELGDNSYYTILFSKGVFVDYNSNPVQYSSDFKHGIGFSIKVPTTDAVLNSSTYQYDIDAASTRHLSSMGFTKDYVIVNNEAQSYNTVFNQNDVIDEEARIIVNELSNGNYSFNFNAITTLGQINGSYTGTVEIID